MNKKKYTIVLIAISILIFGGAILMHIYKSTNPLFEDQAFAKLMAEALDKDVQDITQEDFENITRIEFGFRGQIDHEALNNTVTVGFEYDHSSISSGALKVNLKTWKDLENFPNLKGVYFRFDVDLDHIPDLDTFPKDVALDLSHGTFINPNDIFSLNIDLDLTGLKIDCKNIDSTKLNEHLKNYKNLEILYIENSKDMEVIKDILSLKALRIIYPIGDNIDYSLISNLENLEELAILDKSVYPLSLSFLKPLKNIKKLTLNVENIDTLDGIQYLPNLETLFINPSLLEDISHIKNNRSLTYLNFTNNLLIDVNDLNNLSNLIQLDISYNEIEKIDSLSNLNKLKYLDISSNNIKDFSFLKEMKSLEILYMWNAGEITKEELAEIINALPNLEWIDCGTNEDGIANWVREEFPHINVGNKDLEESADAMYKANSEMMAETEN